MIYFNRKATRGHESFFKLLDQKDQMLKPFAKVCQLQHLILEIAVVVAVIPDTAEFDVGLVVP